MVHTLAFASRGYFEDLATSDVPVVAVAVGVEVQVMVSGSVYVVFVCDSERDAVETSEAIDAWTDAACTG